jgi:hypothetical protein
MTPCLEQRGRCVRSGEREGYRQFDHGIAYQPRFAGVVRGFVRESNQWVSNQFGGPRASD